MPAVPELRRTLVWLLFAPNGLTVRSSAAAKVADAKGKRDLKSVQAAAEAPFLAVAALGGRTPAANQG